MRKTIALTALILLILLSSCTKAQDTSSQAKTFTRITQEEAKKIMDSETDIVILDVRTQEEYDSGHIPQAILIPYDVIPQKAESILKDKNQKILVYCRSGNRSKKGSASLVEEGYTNVFEFGGISTWPYEIVK